MAERSSSLACKKFSENVFDKNKCQNCFKTKDAHSVSPSIPQRPTNIQVNRSRPKITVKSGNLQIATDISASPSVKIKVNTWEKVWFVLYSSGVLEWFSCEPVENGQVAIGNVNLDDCLGLTSAECDTKEPFTIGIKTSIKAYYLKAENRLEVDNWCRVLKPFVIASPGYKFDKKMPPSRALSYHDSKIISSLNSEKSSLSRTVSAPLNTGASVKRWSATDNLLAKNDETLGQTSLKTAEGSREEVANKTTSKILRQPNDTCDLDITPEQSTVKRNDTTGISLENELTEARRVAKNYQGKAEMCSKSLLDTKKQLMVANDVISIQKANIETQTAEIENLKLRLRKSDELVETRLKKGLEVEPCIENGGTQENAESRFLSLQAKFQENEKTLIRRTRELEKANESRKKVAKHTRALLLELEEKLSGNNERISELEEQLVNKTLDLQYEKDERLRVEQEKKQLLKDVCVAQQNTKEREISKRSTELLQQAKNEHDHLKNEKRMQCELQELYVKLAAKDVELGKFREQLAIIDTKETEIKKLQIAYNTSNAEMGQLRNELSLVRDNHNKEEKKCNELERKIHEICVRINQKDTRIKDLQAENAELVNEMERLQEECDERVILLQEDNETTRTRLHEVQQQLNDVMPTEVDGRHSKFEVLSRDHEIIKIELHKSKEECLRLREARVEATRDINNEKNLRLKLEKEFLDRNKALENAENELSKLRELLQVIEGKFEVSGSNHEDLVEKIEKCKIDIEDLSRQLDVKNEQVVDLKNTLENHTVVDHTVLKTIHKMHSSFHENLRALMMCTEDHGSNIENHKNSETNILQALEMLGMTIENVNNAYVKEHEKNECLHSQVQSLQLQSQSSVKGERNEDEVVEEIKTNHRKELDNLQMSMNKENQMLKSQAEELKLKLTSKVILLQSDLTELNAKHEREIYRLNEEHKEHIESTRLQLEKGLNEECQNLQHELKSCREKQQQEIDRLTEQHDFHVESLREEHESAIGENNEEISKLHMRIKELEKDFANERESNERSIQTLKDEYESRVTQLSAQNGRILNVDQLEEEKLRHNKEIQEIKENHRRELEENKSDMLMVLQALKSDSYQSSSVSNDSMETSDELKKLERYVETLKKEHEEEVEKLNNKHEKDLEQLRSDMVTLLRVQETYKTSDGSQPDPKGYIVDYDGHLEALKCSHEQQLREKDEQHKTEVDQLKSDMLVAIQAASAVANFSAQSSAPPDERVVELEGQVAKLERDFEKERENFQNAIKKAESATKFGLRRNEEMSNKIYQMQREMEEIDTKYQKEIKLYKEAFDQEKNRKTTIGAVPGILAENESLKVKLQELELSMEQMEVRYEGEIKRYKEKFQQDNVMNVEELHLKIKSLEDSLEQMRLEHETELERYTKAVKRGKISLNSTAKERDLERKIDDLESTNNNMRQKHREEIRKYRERLEDEMERHRKEVQESRAKLRKLEADTRHMDDMRNKMIELETKTSKLSKDASKYKEQELELNDSKSKNRELQRQVESLKRRVEKLEEAAEETKETNTDSQLTSPRAKLSRYSSLDNIGLNSSSKVKPFVTQDECNNDGDAFEMNNNSEKIGGYKLNPVLKRPASVSAFPVQNENPSRRVLDKKRENSSSLNRASYQTSYIKNSSSVSSQK